MEKTRILIADDEPLARERLRSLLEQQPDVEVVGECGDGREVVAKVLELSPDLLFLDVQMPELDGFGVLQELGPDAVPAIIFVTAHDKFALRAFDVHAIDYLLKPFDQERFEVALHRGLESLKKRDDNDLSTRLKALLADRPQPAKAPERLVVKVDGRVLLVKLDDIDWIEAADNYVSVRAGHENYLLRETMSALESRLPAGKFQRISRSTIVNLDRIKELQPMFHGEYVVILRTGAKLTLSRTYREKLDLILGKLP